MQIEESKRVRNKSLSNKDKEKEMEQNLGLLHDKHLDDNGFVWQDYLDATGSAEVPQMMFPHVELTLQSGFEVGMSMEVPIASQSEGEKKDESYWVATVVMACGPLLRLRYFGGDDRSLEFWFNVTKEHAHELGWSQKNDKRLKPPDSISERLPDWTDKLNVFLKTARTVTPELLESKGLSLAERIKQGMKVELCDVKHPYKLWVATIIENVGGRLLLRYDTPNGTAKTFWVFCTSEHVYPQDFASQPDSKWFLEPPSSIVETHSYEEWKEIIENPTEDTPRSENLFDNNVEHEKHDFEIGMKVEAICPLDRAKICPATVVKVFDDSYFLVEIDVYDEENVHREFELNFNNSEKNTWLCAKDHPYIFPVGWAKKHDLRITHPQGWMSDSTEFDWNEYLKKTQSTAASAELFAERDSAIDAGFECGMRLEAVDPENENVICAAHITKTVENLLWIKLDNYEDSRPEHIVHIHSLQIFPVGWCESNQFPLKPPKNYEEICKKLELPQKKSPPELPIAEPRSSLWCPKIYFNYRCCTGPMISKGKLATLPKAVGPGPVVLVMREVLSMIVSVGYTSARILKVLQCDTKVGPGYHLETLKAKHKSNVYRASVAVVTSGDMVADFCKEICKKLMVCPNLFGPQHIPEDGCPDQCHRRARLNAFQTVQNTTTKGRQAKGTTATTFSSNNSSIMSQQKPKPWGTRRRRKRGRWHRQKVRTAGQNRDQTQEEENGEKDEEDKIIQEDIAEEETPSEENVVVVTKRKRGKPAAKSNSETPPSSNISEDSNSSSIDRKPVTVKKPVKIDDKRFIKKDTAKISAAKRKRENDWESAVENSEGSETEAEYMKMQQNQRRPKTRKLDSNPLFWTVEDVFRYLRKTSDCKEVAYLVREEEIDGLAFLLLNLPSLTQHMKLRTSCALKLCRHVEQVKVTFFLRHVNEEEPADDPDLS